jgi:hypothetical protein
MEGIIIELPLGKRTEKMSMTSFYFLSKWLQIMYTPCLNRTVLYMLNILSIVWKNRAFFI